MGDGLDLVCRVAFAMVDGYGQTFTYENIIRRR